MILILTFEDIPVQLRIAAVDTILNQIRKIVVRLDLNEIKNTAQNVAALTLIDEQIYVGIPGIVHGLQPTAQKYDAFKDWDVWVTALKHRKEIIAWKDIRIGYWDIEGFHAEVNPLTKEMLTHIIKLAPK